MIFGLHYPQPYPLKSELVSHNAENTFTYWLRLLGLTANRVAATR